MHVRKCVCIKKCVTIGYEVVDYLWNEALLGANIVESVLHVVPIWRIYLNPYIHKHEINQTYQHQPNTYKPGKRSDVIPLNKGTSGDKNFGKLTSIIDRRTYKTRNYYSNTYSTYF